MVLASQSWEWRMGNWELGSEEKGNWEFKKERFSYGYAKSAIASLWKIYVIFRRLTER